MLKIPSAAHLNCCKGFRAGLKQASTTHRHFEQFWMILLQDHVSITVRGLALHVDTLSLHFPPSTDFTIVQSTKLFWQDPQFGPSKLRKIPSNKLHSTWSEQCVFSHPFSDCPLCTKDGTHPEQAFWDGLQPSELLPARPNQKELLCRPSFPLVFSPPYVAWPP